MDTWEKYRELRQKTIPGLLLERSRNTPDDIAYRAKEYGIYREVTWSQLKGSVAKCAMGLRALELGRGDRLALMGDPCEEYMICELAAEALGAVTYGIYPTSSQKELQYLMEDGGASIFVAEDQEYVDRILPLFDGLPQLKHIVVIDYQGMFTYDHSALMSYDDLVQMGGEEVERQPEVFEKAVSEVRPTDPAFIVYTSGTTGHPKGALISHGKHLAGTYNIIDRFPILMEVPHRTVVYLPLCHILGKDVAITLPLFSRIVPHYGEDIEDLGQTLFEVAPTILFTVPRYLQKFASKIIVGVENSSPVKKWVYRISLKVGRAHVRKIWESKKNIALKAIYLICYYLCFRPILNKIGFDQLKLAVSGGAPLPSEVMALWQIYGVSLAEMYGQTETAGAIISGQDQSFPRPGNVGVPPRGWEVKLAENGEILVRGEDVFEGYWNRPDLTQEVIDSERWLHTGDVGEWAPEGNLKIVDRVRDIIVTSGGKTLSPTYIENTLRASPYISEAVVFGHNRKYVTALVEIDYETVSAWARSQDITYTGFTSLTLHPEVIKLIDMEIGRCNQDLARVEQVKIFRIIPKELDPEEEGEPITPTRKVKRELMYEKFRDLVESMYSDKEERRVASEIGDLLGQPG
ncbi:MAG: AMP-binding protein [Deltaproteobacteria bacterium]|nr:AMP-binding protein [Deltaproteobacteria bacterium]MBW2138039.1 AMP-binding protein [Deltaproteobacteria bacterium]